MKKKNYEITISSSSAQKLRKTYGWSLSDMVIHRLLYKPEEFLERFDEHKDNVCLRSDLMAHIFMLIECNAQFPDMDKYIAWYNECNSKMIYLNTVDELLKALKKGKRVEDAYGHDVTLSSSGRGVYRYSYGDSEDVYESIADFKKYFDPSDEYRIIA